MEIEVLYEDDYILAVNKPNNVLVYASYYARNIKEPDLVALLKEAYKEEYFPIHRLDRKTSGVILVAKKKEYVKDFQQLFEKSEIQKSYYAIVRGFSKPEGTIDTPTKNADTGKYKEALTEYETLNSIELDIPVQPYEKSRYSLVKFMPKTGRMHQLRIHANKISHPILGDHKYGDRHHNRMFENEMGWSNLFLHANTLVFTHPVSKVEMELKADFPTDWNKAFEKFNWQIVV